MVIRNVSHQVSAVGCRYLIMCASSSSSILHLGHVAAEHIFHLFMLFPWAKNPVVSLLAQQCCAGMLSFTAWPIESQSISLVGSLICCFFFQYLIIALLCICSLSCLSMFLTSFWPLIEHPHGSPGILVGPLVALYVFAFFFAFTSISIFIHASLKSTIGEPVSWCPLTCWSSVSWRFWVAARML